MLRTLFLARYDFPSFYLPQKIPDYDQLGSSVGQDAYLPGIPHRLNEMLNNLFRESKYVFRREIFCGEEKKLPSLSFRTLYGLLVALHGTQCHFTNERLYQIGNFEMPEDVDARIENISERAMEEELTVEEAEMEVALLMRSPLLENIILKQAREEYDSIVQRLYTQGQIEFGLCRQLWLPDIVPMRFYVRREPHKAEPGLQLFVGAIDAREVYDAFLRYFQSVELLYEAR
jgi:hypothetical protein